MSIHKSQGQTLERVRVDLARVFEKGNQIRAYFWTGINNGRFVFLSGQAYVALSRATSLDGLQVLNFDPRKVLAHPRVTEWSKKLETLTAQEL